jgi:hypothetical protein
MARARRLLRQVRLTWFRHAAGSGVAARSGWAATRLLIARGCAVDSQRSAGEAGDQLRRRGIEADDVEHPGMAGVPAVVLVHNGEN